MTKINRPKVGFDAATVRGVVDAYSNAPTVEARVQALADRLGVTSRSIYTYCKAGVPGRANKLFLRELRRVAREIGLG